MFRIPPESIAHLLGIRLDYLRSTNMLKNKEAYLLLKDFLKNSHTIYKNVVNGYLSYNSLFSNFIEEKLVTFEKIIQYYDPNDIEFICKYDKSKTFQLGLEKNYPCDYFISKSDSAGNLYFLGLVHNGDEYMPMSSLYFPKNDDQLSNLQGLLTNQSITYVNNIIAINPVINFKRNRYLHISLKLQKLELIKKYTNSIKGVIIDVSYDLQFILNGYLMKENKINVYKLICRQFMNSIKEHEIFLVEQMDVSLQEQIENEMLDLIQAYNNESCKNDNTKALATYSDLLEKYNELSVEVLNLQHQLEEAEEKANNYYYELQSLEQKNENYRLFEEEIFDLVRRHRIKIEGNEESNY